MKHLSTHPHAFIKNGHIDEIFVFDEDKHDTPFLDEITAHVGAEQIICLCDYFDRTGIEPQKYWSWDGSNFAEPTMEYLLSVGAIERLPEPEPVNEV